MVAVVGPLGLVVAVSPPRGGTYVLLDRDTGEVVYGGRTDDLARRRREHANDPSKGRYDFEVDSRTDDYDEQRGREQILYDKHNPRLNKVRPISLRNSNLARYLAAGSRVKGTY